MPDVNCTVNTCKYWESGNSCTAQNIIIQTDDKGGVSPNASLTQLAATPAQNVDDTCCQTFKNQKG